MRSGQGWQSMKATLPSKSPPSAASWVKFVSVPMQSRRYQGVGIAGFMAMFSSIARIKSSSTFQCAASRTRFSAGLCSEIAAASPSIISTNFRNASDQPSGPIAQVSVLIGTFQHKGVPVGSLGTSSVTTMQERTR